MTTPEIVALLLSVLALLVSLKLVYSRRRFSLREYEFQQRILDVEADRLRISQTLLDAERERLNQELQVKQRLMSLEAERLHILERLIEVERDRLRRASDYPREAEQELYLLRRELSQLSQLSQLTSSQYSEFSATLKQLSFESRRELSQKEQRQLPPPPKNPMIESIALFAGANALMAALQVFQRERDYRLARQTFHENFERNITAPETLQAANALDSVAPADVIKKLYENAKKCWDHWLESEEQPQMPGEEREVDAAVKSCVCRQLRRIIDLNGSLPEEWRSQWDLYGCANRS